jgi:hypothetical protein
MTTNFPSSIDNFTNPTTSDTLASVSHSAQHADVNDAVEAIETALLDGAPLFVDDANERVGIGTTTPSEELDVVGDIQVSGRLGIGGGISAELDIKGASNPEIRLQSTDSSDPFLYFGDQVDSIRGGIGYDTSANALQLQGYNNSTRMTIDSSGNVGIGTTTPSDMLDVGRSGNAGSFRVHASGGLESFRVVTTVVRSKNIVDLTTASAANVFINTSNNTMYRSTSSGKYKTDIETLDDEHANIIFQLRPVWYRSTTGNDPEEYSYYGLIAEEVAEVEPRLVHFGPSTDCACVEDEDGHVEHEQACLTEPEGVFYERLVPHLISVVQRQQTQIDTQQAQIDALTARIEALENPSQE